MEREQLVSEVRQRLQNNLNYLTVNRESIDETEKISICTEMQKEMLYLGLRLEEEFSLQNTRIIKLLEVSCELCYRACLGSIDFEYFCACLNYELYYMEYELTWSVPETANTLALVAIVRDEAYILEWIEFHRLAGVSHFYIYDNESSDGLKDKLQKYIDEGIVTYTFFPGDCVQLAAYNHAIDNYKYDNLLMGFIDGDEYLIPMEENKLLPEIIEKIMDDYEHHSMRLAGHAGAVGVTWRCYGTSFHKERCEGLCIENYNYRGDWQYYRNVHIKTIGIPRVMGHFGNPHFTQYCPSYYCISENGSYIHGSYFHDGRCEKLRINHYFSKSEEELKKKHQRGWPDQAHVPLKEGKSKMWFKEATIDCNAIYDPIMEKYIPEIKRRLGMN